MRDDRRSIVCRWRALSRADACASSACASSAGSRSRRRPCGAVLRRRGESGQGLARARSRRSRPRNAVSRRTLHHPRPRGRRTGERRAGPCTGAKMGQCAGASRGFESVGHRRSYRDANAARPRSAIRTPAVRPPRTDTPDRTNARTPAASAPRSSGGGREDAVGDARAVGESGRGGGERRVGGGRTRVGGGERRVGGDPTARTRAGRRGSTGGRCTGRGASACAWSTRARAPEVTTAVFGAVARRRRRGGEPTRTRRHPRTARSTDRASFSQGDLTLKRPARSRRRPRARKWGADPSSPVFAFSTAVVFEAASPPSRAGGGNASAVRRTCANAALGVSSESDRPSSSKSSRTRGVYGGVRVLHRRLARATICRPRRARPGAFRDEHARGSSGRRQRSSLVVEVAFFDDDFIGTTTSPGGTSQRPVRSARSRRRRVRSVRSSSRQGRDVARARATSVAMPAETPSFVGALFQPAPETPPRESRDDDVGTVEAFRDGGDAPRTHPPPWVLPQFPATANPRTPSSTRVDRLMEASRARRGGGAHPPRGRWTRNRLSSPRSFACDAPKPPAEAERRESAEGADFVTEVPTAERDADVDEDAQPAEETALRRERARAERSFVRRRTSSTFGAFTRRRVPRHAPPERSSSRRARGKRGHRVSRARDLANPHVERLRRAPRSAPSRAPSRRRADDRVAIRPERRRLRRRLEDSSRCSSRRPGLLRSASDNNESEARVRLGHRGRTRSACARGRRLGDIRRARHVARRNRGQQTRRPETVSRDDGPSRGGGDGGVGAEGG